MIWAPNPPHSPYNSIDDCDTRVYNTHYRDLPMDTLLNRPNVRLDKSHLKKPSKTNPSQCAAFYFSNVTSIDEHFGRVLDALEEAGLSENTIVVFTADHGEMMGSHGLMAKNVIYNESFLVPFIVRYPPRLQHRTEDLLLGTVDIMPTLLGMMGLADQCPPTVDGTDYSMGLMTGDYNNPPKPKSALYFHPKRKGVRTGKYVYQVSQEGKTELYDNERDPYQLDNLPLASIEPSDLAELQAELGWWLQKADDAWTKDQTRADLIAYPE